jgi:hydroxyacylglutathione hydrolase
MRILTITNGPFAVNTYLLIDSTGNRCVIVDPGADNERIIAEIQTHKCRPELLVNTHGHFDHIAGNRALMNAYGIPLWIGREDAPMLTDSNLNFSIFTGEEVSSPPADKLLDEGMVVNCGSSMWRVLATPGHSPGSISLYCDGHCLCGDTVFSGSVGRTDLPGADAGQLLTSIKNKLLKLPATTKLYPGHGPPTTVADESRHNPFLQ